MKQIENPNNLPKNPDENLPEAIVEKISDRYSIIERGALSYIKNSKGKIVSNGHHDFKVLRHGDIMCLIGKTGACSKILKTPETEDGFFEESPIRFHEIHFDDELGLLISTEGANNFIIDMNTASKVSKGYHEFFKKDGKLYGRKGSKEEEINLPAQERLEERKLIE